MLMNKIEALLRQVEKPSRYIGDEINSVLKPITGELIRYGFCFPDVYEVGMSHVGSHILYGVLNNIEDVFCERIYSPWGDLEALLRADKLPLFTMETKSDIKEMDILNFTLQYELSYTNILNILDMSFIPLRSKDRKEEDPIIMAGGPCAYNPEPIAEIIDLFSLGEGEEVFIELMDLLREKKKNNWTKDEFLKKAALIKGIYVPKFYTVTYNDDDTIKSFEPVSEEFPRKIQKRIIEDMNTAYYPSEFVIPYADIVHDRAQVEIFRGCTRGCRFCQAGMIYRPVREKSKEVIVDTARKIIEATGYEELSLTSLSTLDHTEINDTVYQLIEEQLKNKVSISLPSLRLDNLPVDVLQEIQKIKKTGLTFAPEAGSQRLRDVINKGVTQEDLDETLTQIFSLGWQRVKLYFMLGLPTETFEDIDGINELGNRAAYLHRIVPKELKNSPVSVTLSTGCFVPKAFTPFQWFEQNSLELMREKQIFLKKLVINKKLKFTYMDAKTSVLEGVFARGDRRLNEVLITAFEMGCKFDGWTEHFNFETWLSAFEKHQVLLETYTRGKSYDEILPWDFIDIGVRKEFLIQEYENSLKGIVTADCRENCVGCGINIDLLGSDC